MSYLKKMTLSLGLFLAANGASAFCGPHFTEYRVLSNDPGTVGVRCVQVGAYGMSWYGEGTWRGSSYRHIGRAVRGEFGLVAWMADIYGNGEAFQNRHDGIMPVYEGPWASGSPARIRLTQTFNELWVKATPSMPRYQSNLPVIQYCGRHFARYRVGPYSNGTGIRCVLPGNGSAPHLFVGEGHWGGKRYMHLGTGSSVNRAYASDICKPGYGFCGTVGYDSIVFTPVTSTQLRLSGSWNEAWNRLN